VRGPCCLSQRCNRLRRRSGGGTTLVRLVEQGHRLDFASWAQFAERLAKDRATAQQQREQEANVYTGSHW